MSEGKIETPRQYYKRYITENKYDDTDMFTKAMVMVFSFQDAYEEKCAALDRCQQQVHKLEHQVMEFSDHLINFSKALGAKDGDDMLDILYKHFTFAVAMHPMLPPEDSQQLASIKPKG